MASQHIDLNTVDDVTDEKQNPTCITLRKFLNLCTFQHPFQKHEGTRQDKF